MSIWEDMGDFFGTYKKKVPGIEDIASQFDPSAARLDTTAADGAGLQQSYLMGMLNNQAMGQGGPSVAENQMRMGSDQAMRNAMALSASQQGRGLGYQSALSNIGNQQAMIQAQGAGDAAQLRAKEQMGARMQLQQLLGQMRGQGLETAQAKQHANLGYQQMLANYNRGIQNQHSEDQKAAGAATNQAMSNGASAIGYAAMMASRGGKVSGHAKVSGDSYANDVIPALLSPGEVVLPRSVSQSEDPEGDAARFVRALRDGGHLKRMAEGGELEEASGGGGLDPEYNTPIGADEAPFEFQNPLEHESPDFPEEDTAAPTEEPVRLAAKAPAPGGAVAPPDGPAAGASPVGAPAPAASPASGGVRFTSSGGVPGPDFGEYREYKKETKAAYADQAKAMEESADLAKRKAVEMGDIKREQLSQEAKTDDQVAQSNAAYHEELQKRQRGIDEWVDRYANADVDKGRLWSTRSTGEKVLAGIGMILGTFGGSRGNAGVEAIDKAINRDMDLQRASIDKAGKVVGMKQSAMEDARKTFQDETQARAAHKIAGLRRAELQLEEVGARYSGPEAEQRLFEGKSALKMKMAEEMQKASVSINAQAMAAAKDRAELELLRARAQAASSKGGNSGLLLAQTDQIINEAAKKFGNVGALGAAGSSGREFNHFIEANAMALATAMTPGGKPPRTHEEAMKRINLGLMPTLIGKKTMAERLSEMRKAMYRAQSFPVPGGGGGMESEEDGG